MQTLPVEQLIAKILKDQPIEEIVLTARRFLMVAYLREQRASQCINLVRAISRCDLYLTFSEGQKEQGRSQS